MRFITLTIEGLGNAPDTPAVFGVALIAAVLPRVDPNDADPENIETWPATVILADGSAHKVQQGFGFLQKLLCSVIAQ